MTRDDLKALAHGLAPVIKDLLRNAVVPLTIRMEAAERRAVELDQIIARVLALEQRTILQAPDGKDDDITDAMKQMVSEQVSAAVALLPVPKDGQSLTAEDVRPLVVAQVAEAVASLPAPKDGIGVTGAVLDRSGELVIVLSDGTSRSVGAVVGKDGKDADMDAVLRFAADELAKWPKPKDGTNGVDGLGFDDMDETYDGDRTITRTYRNGERVKIFTFTVPRMKYHGVFQPETVYGDGDAVTRDGSVWIARRETTVTPGTENGDDRAWVLAVKRGSDGKQGLKGKDGEGKAGKDGRDLTGRGWSSNT